MWLKVAGGVDQFHIPGREDSLAQGRGAVTLILPSRPSISPLLPEAFSDHPGSNLCLLLLLFLTVPG